MCKTLLGAAVALLLLATPLGAVHAACEIEIPTPSYVESQVNWYDATFISWTSCAGSTCTDQSGRVGDTSANGIKLSDDCEDDVSLEWTNFFGSIITLADTCDTETFLDCAEGTTSVNGYVKERDVTWSDNGHYPLSDADTVPDPRDLKCPPPPGGADAYGEKSETYRLRGKNPDGSNATGVVLIGAGPLIITHLCGIPG